MPRTFSVEPAKSGRSRCKCCNEKIADGSIRMGTHQESSDDYPGMTKWFHLGMDLLIYNQQTHSIIDILKYLFLLSMFQEENKKRSTNK